MPPLPIRLRIVFEEGPRPTAQGITAQTQIISLASKQILECETLLVAHAPNQRGPSLSIFV